MQLQHPSSPPSCCPVGIWECSHTGQLPQPFQVLGPGPGTPLPPGSFGVGGGVSELGVFPALPKVFLGRRWRQDPSPPWQPDFGVPPYPPVWSARLAVGCTFLAPHTPGCFSFPQGQQDKLGGPSSVLLRCATAFVPLCLEVRSSRREPCWKNTMGPFRAWIAG